MGHGEKEKTTLNAFKSSKVSVQDFPGGPVVKNPPCNARDAGSVPGWGTKMPHALPQLAPDVAKYIK